MTETLRTREDLNLVSCVSVAHIMKLVSRVGRVKRNGCVSVSA